MFAVDEREARRGDYCVIFSVFQVALFLEQPGELERSISGGQCFPSEVGVVDRVRLLDVSEGLGALRIQHVERAEVHVDLGGLDMISAKHARATVQCGLVENPCFLKRLLILVLDYEKCNH